MRAGDRVRVGADETKPDGGSSQGSGLLLGVGDAGCGTKMGFFCRSKTGQMQAAVGGGLRVERIMLAGTQLGSPR